MKYKWQSSGYLYDGGDIPKCSYCAKDGLTSSIYETAHNGILVCDNEHCALSYVTSEIMCNELEKEIVEDSDNGEWINGEWIEDVDELYGEDCDI